MLLPSNSRIRTFFFVLAALAFSQATNAGSFGKSPSHTLPAKHVHRSHHVFLTRLPRTNKARKYDIFFLNQLPRQATAFAAPPKGMERANDI